MPLIFLLRFVFSVLGFAILIGGGYLLWSWYGGDTIRLADGTVVRVRQDWHLWVGVAALIWSAAGRFIMPLVLARPDGEKTEADYGNGQILTTASGAEIYVESLGHAGGPTIIFTHGWSMDSTIWHYAKRDLGSSFRVLVWDLPGMGRSKGDITIEHFAECLRSVIAWSGDTQVVLVGHSIGGMTIQTLFRDHPELFRGAVAGIVLVNTTYTNPLKTAILPRLSQALRFPVVEPMMWLTILLRPLAQISAWQSYLNGMAHLANRFGFGKFVTRSQLNHTALLTTRNSQAAIARGNLAMFRWDATAATSALPVPLLVLAGSVDILTKPEASNFIAAATPHARLQVIEGVNHCGFLERADLYDHAIADFVRGVQPVPAPTRVPDTVKTIDGNALVRLSQAGLARCPITLEPARLLGNTDEYSEFDCPTCGVFRITGTALSLAGDDPEVLKEALGTAINAAKLGEVPTIRNVSG